MVGLITTSLPPDPLTRRLYVVLPKRVIVSIVRSLPEAVSIPDPAFLHEVTVVSVPVRNADTLTPIDPLEWLTRLVIVPIAPDSFRLMPLAVEPATVLFVKVPPRSERDTTAVEASVFLMKRFPSNVREALD